MSELTEAIQEVTKRWERAEARVLQLEAALKVLFVPYDEMRDCSLIAVSRTRFLEAEQVLRKGGDASCQTDTTCSANAMNAGEPSSNAGAVNNASAAPAEGGSADEVGTEEHRGKARQP